jgi:glycosyltransferase involved in cell wall biosynthesis
MSISLAIPSFNRSDFTIESFIQVLNNDLIDDIVIVDDHSDIDIFIKLWNLVNELNSDKIKLLRNKKNLKPLLNKYEAVKNCKNDWAILLDSDNIISNDYIEIVSKLDAEEDIIYCPELLYTLNKTVVWCSFKEFNYVITKKEANRNIEDGMFQTLLNTGNYFCNRKKYMDVKEDSYNASALSANDAMYFSYAWLFNGNKIKVVPDLAYVHRQHGGGIGGSWYANNLDACLFATYAIIKKIKKWNV